MVRFGTAAIIAAGFLVFCGPAVAETRVGLLEMTVEGGTDPVISAQLTNRLAELLAARPDYKVIAPDDIRALLEREATLQMLGCDDDSCLAEIGGALGADILIKGRVSKLDSGYAVSLSAVDPVQAEVLGRASQSWGGASIGLLALMAPMVDLLLPVPGAGTVGAIEVSGAELGSQILIDDQLRGTAPAGQLGQITIGSHKVEVVGEGYAVLTRWVVVRKGEVLQLPVRQVELQTDAFYTTWWFWTAAAVAVAGAATGAAVGLGGSGSDGATGVNISVNSDTAFGGSR